MGVQVINEASLEREKQRSESEARDIIHDLDRLYTLPEERKPDGCGNYYKMLKMLQMKPQLRRV